MKRKQINNKIKKNKTVSNGAITIRQPKSSSTGQIDFDKPLESGGAVLGKKLGEFAGRLLGRITGMGDYTADLPAGGSAISETAVPEFIKTTNGRETRIRHREFVGNVYASPTAGLFANTLYSFNPGNPTLFPWLAGIAQHYDSWEPNGCAVIFKTLTSTYAASQSLGTVIVASDYDVYDEPYANKIEMENSEFAVSGSAAQCLMHPIECNPSERMTKLFNVRNGDLDVTDNKRFFDLCNLQIASEGCLANQLLGELWITYDISFYKPAIPRNPSSLGLPTFTCTTLGTNANELFGTIVNVNLSPFNTPNFVTVINSNTLSFSRFFVGYRFLVQIRFVKIPAVGPISFGVNRVGFSTVANMWTLTNNNTPTTIGVADQSLIAQGVYLMDNSATTNTLSFTTPPCLLGIYNRYSAFVSVVQVPQGAFNYNDWAGLP